jgi:ribosomal protein S18 acetylase RimI-like enzyme
MKIVSVHVDHIDPLWKLYCAQVADVPHCALLPDRARFGEELLGVTQGRQPLYQPPQQATVLVAENAGTVQGFATLATYREEDEPPQQAITGLFFATAAAGHRLVRACEAQAGDGPISAFPAGHGNTKIQSYNAGWDGLSDRVPAVACLLAQCGYRPYMRELHLSKVLSHPLDTPPVPLPTPLRLTEPSAQADYPGALAVLALAGESEAGICAYSTLEPLTNHPDAHKVGYIGWLHVEDAYRRRGVARALMTDVLGRLAAQGCEQCWLTTTADNWPAQTLYLALGFAVVDCSVSFRKGG